MTFEEARAQFAVLDRIAYLNAGTFGPMPRAVHRRTRRRDRPRLRGRAASGCAYFDRAMALATRLRRRLAALVGADPLQVALTASTTDGCNIVLAGLGLGPKTRS